MNSFVFQVLFKYISDALNTKRKTDAGYLHSMLRNVEKSKMITTASENYGIFEKYKRKCKSHQYIPCIESTTNKVTILIKKL